MKRKLLSVLLTFCLAFSLLPTAALADEGEASGNAAKIDDATYETFDEALFAAKAGDTITLLKDVMVDNRDTSMWRTIIDKPITLELNDKTIKSPNGMGENSTNFAALFISADVTINATTGGINTGISGAYAINVMNGATLTINGGTYYGGGTAVQVQKGTLIINDGHFSCEPFGEPYGYKYLINCIDKAWKNETAKVFIKGGTFVKFDPSDSASENPNGNFLAEGYGVKQDGDNYIVTEPVAAIGDTKYPTLAAAVAAAQDGNTITLLKDATGRISVSAGTTLTLDLGGHKLSNDSYALDVYGNLTVKNGTVETPADASIWVNNGGTFTLEADATVKANAGCFCVAVYGTASQTDVTANITIKGTLEGGSGLTVNGYIDAGNTMITVADGAKILGDANSSVGLYLAGKATTMVGNAEIVCYDSAVEIRAGGLNITSGKFTATGVPTTVTPNGNGTTSTGAAIAVAQHTTKQEINVNISGGEFNGYSTLYESNPQKNSADDIAKVTMNVADGKFKAINGGTMAVYSEDCTGFITGGLFTSDPSAYCAAGKTGVASGNSQYPYTVGTKVANAQPAHVDTATVPAKTTSNDDTVKNVASEITGANVTNNAAEAATKDLANENKLTGDDQITVNGTTKTITEAVKEVTSDSNLTKDNVAIVYQTYVDVTVTDAKKDAIGVTEITVDLTPMYRVVATTSTVVGNDDEIKVYGDNGVTDPNAVVIQEGKKLNLPEQEYEVKLALPDGFAAAGNKLSIKHTKDNGTVEYYTGTVIQEGGKTYVTFTTKGFSPFVVSAAAASIDGVMYPTLAEAVANVTDGQTIQLEAACAETVTVSRTVKFTLKTNSMNFTGSINPGSRTTLTTSGAEAEKEYTFTYSRPSSGGSSSGSATYTITVDKSKNGAVTVSPKSASKGDRVTVTVKPDSGYVLETLTVTDKNGNELTLKDKGNGKYTFTMPAGKVEVKATFMEDNSMLNFFYDVPNNAYFYEAVKWAVENGITTGVGNDLFAPEQPCTRAQIVTFLWRAAGSPEPKGAASGMSDVVSGSYYEKAVAWAIENGITTGTTTSTFSPDVTCTRAQAVTFLARALKAKAASAAEFSDVPTGSYFADAVAWAAANGVTEGIGGGLFGSDNDCTRGQIVTFLYRAYNK